MKEWLRRLIGNLLYKAQKSLDEVEREIEFLEEEIEDEQ